MKKKTSLKNQQGISLYMITIMIAVLMSFSLSAAAIIVGSAKISASWSDSVKSFHCADSGVEEALYNAYLLVPDCNDILNGEVDNQAAYSYSVVHTYDLDVNPESDCEQTGTTITSVGSFGAASRKIEVNY
jgi:Tfp pilus assembly protein PilX